MAYIYANATVTLIVTQDADADFGLLRPKRGLSRTSAAELRVFQSWQ
jgi:hypothetical protein